MKRWFDFIVALVLLCLLSPVFFLVATLVRVTLGQPILFIQFRPGKDERTFRMFKFRTMLDVCDASGNPLPDDQRLTALGRLLRSTSLDELPELLNVLRGEMSLVGPRPLLVRYLDRYNDHQRRRHEVLPGITGWAQVSGRNNLEWEEKLDLDVWYVDNRTFWLDIKILFRTINCVLVRTGVSAAGHATAPEFMGCDRVDKPSR